MERNIYKIGKELFITNDEEIKDCWFINLTNNEIGYIKNNIGIQKNAKKIILTTDQDLIKDGVQAIDDEFLEWFVNNPSCEEVDVVEDKKLSSKSIYDAVEGDLVYCNHGYGGIINNLSNDIRVGINNYVETAITSITGWETLYINNYKIYDKCYKIIIPKEEPKQECTITKIMQMDAKMAYDSLPKQETLEEAAEEYQLNDKIYHNIQYRSFRAGAKWMQERITMFQQKLGSFGY